MRLHPRDAADDAEWLDVTAWQGGGLVVNRLKKIGAGVYRTTEPIPVHGDWKALIRLHKGDSLTALPIYLPARLGDPGQARSRRRRSFTRAFVADHKILQREQKGAPARLWAIAYALVAAIALALLALLAWGLHRLARSSRLAGGGEPPAQRTETRPAGTPTPATS